MMRVLLPVCHVFPVAIAACSMATPPGRADASNEPVEIPTCDVENLEIGRCEVEATGEACNGSEEEPTVFVPLAPDYVIEPVVGPQGARMFVLSLRTTGIEPGDVENPASTDRPNVTISLFRDEKLAMGRYTGRPTFAAKGDENQDALGVFLIIDHPITDKMVFQVVAQLSDKNGEVRCGKAEFRSR